MRVRDATAHLSQDLCLVWVACSDVTTTDAPTDLGCTPLAAPPPPRVALVRDSTSRPARCSMLHGCALAVVVPAATSPTSCHYYCCITHCWGAWRFMLIAGRAWVVCRYVSDLLAATGTAVCLHPKGSLDPKHTSVHMGQNTGTPHGRQTSAPAVLSAPGRLPSMKSRAQPPKKRVKSTGARPSADADAAAACRDPTTPGQCASLPPAASPRQPPGGMQPPHKITASQMHACAPCASLCAHITPAHTRGAAQKVT